MRRIVLQCKGRLANLMLCYANARHVLDEMGVKDSVIVLNYDLPPDTIRFPGAQAFKLDTAGLRKVTRTTLNDDVGDCLWLWTDVYDKFPDTTIMTRLLRSIEVTEKFEAELKAVINRPTLGVHVRHGDYEKWNGSDPKPAFPRAPDEYYTKWTAKYPDDQIFLASDGEDAELEFITKLPNVIRGRRDNPVFDLFALSRCFAIVGSASTFSSVAACIGDIPVSTPSNFV